MRARRRRWMACSSDNEVKRAPCINSIRMRWMRPLTLLLCALPGASLAASFAVYDPRSIALGSSGVASSAAYNAPALNPALVTRSAELPRGVFARASVGVRINDRDDFRGSLDRYKANDNEDAFSDALRNFNEQIRQGSLTVDDYTRVLDTTEALLADIRLLSDKPLHASGGVNLAVGHARDGYGVAFFVEQTTVGGSIVRISQNDIDNIQIMLGVLRDIEEAVRNDTVPQDYALPDPIEEFTSDVAVEAALISEYGTTLGWHPDFGPWRIGVTLKRVNFASYDYVLPLSEARGTSFRWSEHKREDSFANIDLGASWENGAWRIGLVARNLRKRDVVTVRGGVIHLRPQVRTGVAYETPEYLLTADVDLTRNEPLGFDPDTRFLSIGGEIRTWKNTALRAGLRHNLVSGENAPSFGLGLGPPQAHLDIAGTSWKGHHAFAVQLGLQF